MNITGLKNKVKKYKEQLQELEYEVALNPEFITAKIKELKIRILHTKFLITKLKNFPVKKEKAKK